MRIQIEVDDRLAEEVLRRTGLPTLEEAVDKALRMFLQRSRQAEIRQYRGKLDWEGDLDAMRTDR